MTRVTNHWLCTYFAELAVNKDLTKFKKIHMAKKEFSFNEAVIEIEKILRNIESGDLDVDKLSLK